MQPLDVASEKDGEQSLSQQRVQGLTARELVGNGDLGDGRGGEVGDCGGERGCATKGDFFSGQAALERIVAAANQAV